MSRAFVKEDSGEGLEDLPDRPISEHRNLVTADGLAAIDAEVRRLTAAYAAAQASADRAELQRLARDLRYWSQRQQSAEPMPEPVANGAVQFGSRVTLLRADGRRVTYRLVGEDEADPSRGTISYVSPLARALIGKGEGDNVPMGAATAEIERIA
ncbi:MAG: transcription elongation factor GreA [Hyphomicrobium sp.]|jgi:transcription elongation GreA/GreB family factor|nr:transcription elongation factor GreA [Hyphomicrobium sp.]